MNNLKLEWSKLPSGKTIGHFIDRTGRSCAICNAEFYNDVPTITIATGTGTLVLNQAMSAELCLVLGYFGYSGKLPEVG